MKKMKNDQLEIASNCEEKEVVNNFGIAYHRKSKLDEECNSAKETK